MPAADEVGRLQRGEDAECRLFQALAEQGHYAGRTVPSDTRQGIYATTADGRCLASINTRDPRHVARMLRRALASWEALAPREEGAAPPLEGVNRFEDVYPEDGLVLKVFTRDLPRDRDGDGDAPSSDWRRFAWNQDFAWFTAEEARGFVPATIEAGATHDVPFPLVARIVRLHLVDNVRGQVPAFARESVEVANLSTRVDRVEDGVVFLSFDGRTRAAENGRWPVRGFADGESAAAQRRGVETVVRGHAVWVAAASQFRAFELVAIGTRFGGSQFNARGDDLEPSPIGAVLRLAGRGPDERVAPALYWHYGWRAH